MLTNRDEGFAWVGQQCVITFLVASAFPAPFSAAVDRALLLFSGGALQFISSSLLLQVFGELQTRLFQLSCYLREEEIALRRAFLESAESLRRYKLLNPAIPYALRLALTLGIATEIYRRLHYPSGYWIPMTAMLVLKPDLGDTVSRVIARMLGTMCGAIASSLLLTYLHPSTITFAIGTVLFAWLSYGFLNVNYAVFTMTVTSYVVFLLALSQTPGKELAERRALCTAIGALIALCTGLIVIACRRRNWASLIRH